jgi:drug/metabolite transporter (DMT)-like permease
MDLGAGAIVVLCWGSVPLAKRSLGPLLSPHEFTILNHAVSTVLIILLVLYLISTGGMSLQNFRKLRGGDVAVVCFISTAAVASSLCLMYLLQRREASRVMAVVQPLAIITTVAAGILFASESLSLSKICGCLLVCTGVGVLFLKS